MFGSTQENFAGAQNGCEILQTNKMAAKSFRSQRLISQPKADFAALRNWPSAWSDLLAMAVTPSFQLRIVHCLKHWIFDFLSFEMVYSM